jgi:protein TonB
MEYALQHRSAGRNVTGLSLVIALHVVVVLAFMAGTRTGIIVRNHETPITVFTEDVAKPPQPATPDVRRVIQNVVTTVPSLDEFPIRLDAPRDPPVASQQNGASASGPTKGADRDEGTGGGQVSNVVGVACPNARRVQDAVSYPVQAQRQGLEGDVLARFVVGSRGEIRDIRIVQSSHRSFNNAVTDAVREFRCIGQGQDVTVEVPFSFRLN